MSITKTTREQGRLAENKACDYLVAHGLSLLESNAQPRGDKSDLDLILQEADTLVFVEVRYRQTLQAALASINKTKQARLRRAAMRYLIQKEKYATVPYRFDVVAVAPHRDQAWQYHWIKNAF